MGRRCGSDRRRIRRSSDLEIPTRKPAVASTIPAQRPRIVTRRRSVGEVSGSWSSPRRAASPLHELPDLRLELPGSPADLGKEHDRAPEVIQRFVGATGDLEQVGEGVLEGRLAMPIALALAQGQRLASKSDRALRVALVRADEGECVERGDPRRRVAWGWRGRRSGGCRPRPRRGRPRRAIGGISGVERLEGPLQVVAREREVAATAGHEFRAGSWRVRWQ